MQFRIADTFTDSLGRLSGDEQKAVKTTVFDLQVDPVNPGMQLHKLDKTKDKNFWSVRVSRDIRLIVHKTADSMLLCYVGHHDKAYQWAERRKLEIHPTTGAAQLVEIRERVEEIVVRKIVEQSERRPAKPPLFKALADEELLAYGVPQEWVGDVRAADEDSLLELAGHLPAEAAEALLELATGGKPKPAFRDVLADPFAHPDAQRRFRVMHDTDELERALAYPWEKWTIFLHPAQRQFVEGQYNGPARISGSAGTGKTIVALHRAVQLARAHPDARVLLTTFSKTLANQLRGRLRRLIGNEPRLAERLEVSALDDVALRLYASHFGKAKLAAAEDLRALVQEAMANVETPLMLGFVLAEWMQIVDAMQLTTWEAYREAKRTGRKTRLNEAQRAALWQVFEQLRAKLEANRLITSGQMYGQLADVVSERKHPPFDYVVIDEAQDVSAPQLRFLAAIGSERSNALFFAGDLGQRIFQTPFSWKSLGVDIRGRSRTLHINYRTSHQIRAHSDRLLGSEVSDIDGNVESRRGTVSVFNGPPPSVKIFEHEGDEIDAVASWIGERTNEGIEPHEIGVFVRARPHLDRALTAASRAGLAVKVLDDVGEGITGYASVSTMHLAKGLEFRAVAVMACDDEVIPLQERIESATDEGELEDVYNTERHLLYVACTRARDYLVVTAVAPGSEFLEDLGS